MLYNSTCYRTSDLKAVMEAIFTTLALVAPDAAMNLGAGTYYPSDVLRYQVPERVIVGYSRNLAYCTTGTDLPRARGTMFLFMPVKGRIYSNELQMLGMIGLYPDVPNLMTTIAYHAMKTHGRRNNLWSCALPEEHRQSSPWAGVAQYAQQINPGLEIHIDNKANAAEVRACREQRALLHLEEVDWLLTVRKRRLRRAEWNLEYAQKTVDRSNAAMKQALARLEKFGGNNG